MNVKRVLLLVMALGAGAATGEAGIAGSKHDFHNLSWSGGQICLPCHAPHNNQNTAGTLLWNHASSSAVYTFYSSPTMNATTPTVMSDISKTCMGCHDGTVAVDSFGGTNGTTIIALSSRMGQALGNDHPVSIVYNAALATADRHLFNPSVALSGMGTGSTTVEADMLYGVAGFKKVECNSCHDVHNQYNIPGMLKKTNAGSQLCLTCHNQ